MRTLTLVVVALLAVGAFGRDKPSRVLSLPGWKGTLQCEFVRDSQLMLG